MDETSDMTRWDEIAWNGIAFRKPSHWEIATIGRNYLMLGTRTDPRMEITWGNLFKKTSHKRSLKQLQTQIRRKHHLTTDPWTPPQDWLQALPAHEVSGISFKESAGNALIVSCTFCNRASLFQFYQCSSEDPSYFHKIVSKLLSTFRDHSEDNRQQWAVFDVRAILPAALQIKSYQFSPGFMTMDFSAKGLGISLYRWSPASVLLAGRKLPEFAGSLPFYPGSTSGKQQDVNRMEWEKSPSISLLTRIATFLSARFSHHRLLIRHDTETNRILAVRSESRHPMDPVFFAQIAADYETVTA
ncbi:MAG: hypothetical protein HY881_17715 [Deltaproteobacteria bacterium]|nr:hypothetical protein [Deltaproteobacteria bacterium]